MDLYAKGGGPVSFLQSRSKWVCLTYCIQLSDYGYIIDTYAGGGAWFAGDNGKPLVSSMYLLRFIPSVLNY